MPKGGVEPPFRVYESLVLAVELLRRTCILTYFRKKYSPSPRFRVISECMWDNLLFINSLIWVCTSVYFVYSIGAAILKWDIRIFLGGLGLFLLSLIVQIILAGLKKY